MGDDEATKNLFHACSALQDELRVAQERNAATSDAAISQAGSLRRVARRISSTHLAAVRPISADSTGSHKADGTGANKKLAF